MRGRPPAWWLAPGAPARAGLALGGTEPAGPRLSPAGRGRLAALALAFGALDVGLAHPSLARRDAAARPRARGRRLPRATRRAPGRPAAQLEAAVAAATRRAARSGARPARLEVCASSRRACRRRSASTWTSSPSRRDGILLHGRAESFDAVDALRRALAASPLLADVTADETRTTVDGRRVEFRLRAERKPALGASS